MTTSLADAIALNKDSGISAPEFRVPLIPAIDRPHCETWEGLLKKFATEWEIRLATPELWNQIPATSGLYMFAWRIPVGFGVSDKGKYHFRQLLYCGQAGAGSSRSTLRDRYKNEYSKYLKGDPATLFERNSPTGRKELLSRWLLLHPMEYWWAEVEDTDRLGVLEKELIRILAPPLNTQHKVLRPGSRRAAF